MSLKDILSDVQAQLTALHPGIVYDFGPENVLNPGVPPRIIFVPKGGGVGPVVGPGRNPRPLRTWSYVVEAHVWGKSVANAPTSADHYAATEQLVNDLGAAVHHSAHGSYSFDEAVWPETNGDLLALGRVCVATFTFHVPITDSTTATAVATTSTIKTA